MDAKDALGIIIIVELGPQVGDFTLSKASRITQIAEFEDIIQETTSSRAFIVNLQCSNLWCIIPLAKQKMKGKGRVKSVVQRASTKNVYIQMVRTVVGNENGPQETKSECLIRNTGHVGQERWVPVTQASLVSCSLDRGTDLVLPAQKSNAGSLSLDPQNMRRITDQFRCTAGFSSLYPSSVTFADPQSIYHEVQLSIFTLWSPNRF